MSDASARCGTTEREVLRDTLRFNTLVFGVILGALSGITLCALAMIASGQARYGGLAVVLIGVFLPGFSADSQGALIGIVWGFVIGAALGGIIYRLNSFRVLQQIDELVIERDQGDDFPRAVLRLHGSSLGVAIGAAGAVGLVATTNLLVARGTADESIRARLLAEILPGYSVSPWGSVIGALELFAILFVLCYAFASIYNGLAGRR
jgi:hypothetical protein